MRRGFNRKGRWLVERGVIMRVKRNPVTSLVSPVLEVMSCLVENPDSRHLSHTTIGSGKHGFPSAQPDL
ncbi:hypothetical protein P175DRAFT_0498838 [Aspergillus ochraceoroseus IBT 24754]|uniref:Uncharacterized protein n=1 Tax=Aspergillus ochraceoroseus IBT 24754 TaxID=1392256 RepID=A0A2T5M1A6_9EURO|nr:uncharacterized protein P175DRAFT_0498838 [Aspergillus ochraceoroseus IBT 24754]PTU22310.1 hypothetical protein P175DRAFT_0498838 [Aspergillus ochraceoroseus IBT 24754]